jgi:hypothetical protein
VTPKLRKAHRYIWFLLTVLLPSGWLAAIWAIPGEVWQTPVRPEQPAAMPLLLQSKESGDFIINLRQGSAGERRQIEIFIKKPLTNPNTTVTAEGGGLEEEGKILGLLGTRGIYRFDLDSLTAKNQPLKLRFEDRIQNRTLRTVIFE